MGLRLSEHPIDSVAVQEFKLYLQRAIVRFANRYVPADSVVDYRAIKIDLRNI